MRKEKGVKEMVKVVARNEVRQECLVQAVEMMRELVAETRKENGCIVYEVYQDKDRENILTMIEEWQSEEALAAHMKTPHFTRIVPLLGELMMQATDVNIYRKMI